MHELQRRQFIPRPLDEVFGFFGQPENLALLTPPWLGFEILTPSPVPMQRGALIDYRIRLGPAPMRWRTLITHFEPPVRFVDEQLDGPYSYWHHTHGFRAVSGGTEVEDHVRYLLPAGPVGRVLEALVVRRQLRSIFDYRQRVIADRFGADAGPGEG